ncbi:MAG: SGNH/GDSL hydrolase family protein [Planctomycetota bacterium]
MAPSISNLKKLAFGVVTNIVLLAAAELAARAFNMGVAPKVSTVEFVGNDFTSAFPSVPDEDLFWKIPPGAPIPMTDERMNSAGFRGPEFIQQKQNTTKRIVCLGDSNTFGIGVSFDETFSNRLGRWITSGGEKWEIINCGVPGYSSFQMLQCWRTRAASYGADVVILYAGAWNDYTPAIGVGDIRAFQLIHQQKRGALSIRNLHIFRGASEIFAERGVDSNAKKRKDYSDLWSNEAKRPDGPRLSHGQFRGTLTSICNDVRATGAKIIIVIPPAPVSTREKFKDGENYAKIAAEVASASADGAVDARAALWRPETAPRELFVDVIHPAPHGHAVIAELLANKLKELKLTNAERPELLLAPPVNLKKLQINAVHESGDPLTPVSAADAMKLDAISVALFNPNRITFSDINIPPNSSLCFATAIFTRDSISPDATKPNPPEIKKIGPVRFVIRAAAAGEAAKIIYDATSESDNKTVWSPPVAARADLGEFSNKTVTLTFEASGPALGTSWGIPKICPCR